MLICVSPFRTVELLVKDENVVKNNDYRELIVREFRRRQEEIPEYSLRAFSRDLDLPPTRLSDILNRRSGLSKKYAQKIVPNLRLTKNEEELFLALVELEHGRSYTVKKVAKAKVQKIFDDPHRDLEGTGLFSKWWHYALLGVVRYFKRNSPQFYADILGVELFCIQESLDLMKRTGLISSKSDELITSPSAMAVFHGVSKASLLPKETEVAPLEQSSPVKVSRTVGAYDVYLMSVFLGDCEKEFFRCLNLREVDRKFLFNIEVIPLPSRLRE